MVLQIVKTTTTKTKSTNKKTQTDSYALRLWQIHKEQFVGKNPVVEQIKRRKYGIVTIEYQPCQKKKWKTKT